MKKKLITFFAVLSFVALGLSNSASADFLTIGTAQFGGTGTEYNLIWDDNNNGNSVVWLDYTNGSTTWENQSSWASGLNTSLIYNINPGYTVNWGANSWRLPSAGTNPIDGYNQTTSEMGHLFYTELGLDRGATTADELNATNFDRLFPSWYWSSTGYIYDASHAWYFNMQDGNQTNDGTAHGHYGLAVRSGQVSVVPVPAAAWLLASGLVGLAGIRRKKK